MVLYTKYADGYAIDLWGIIFNGLTIFPSDCEWIVPGTVEC